MRNQFKKNFRLKKKKGYGAVKKSLFVLMENIEQNYFSKIRE